jgi:predicted  nucleic acid-binding Zn-ribbon protein
MSEASEEALTRLNETSDAFRSEMDTKVKSYETELAGLRDRIAGLSAALEQAEGEIRKERDTWEAEKLKWEEDKKVLESAIIDLGVGSEQGERDRTERRAEVEGLEGRIKVGFLNSFFLFRSY